MSPRPYPFHPVKLAGAGVLGVLAAVALLSAGGTQTPAPASGTPPSSREEQVSAPTLVAPPGAVEAGPGFDLAGTGTPGSRVRILLDGQEAGTATVGTDGRFKALIDLKEGTSTAVAETLDASGKTLASSAPLELSAASSSASTPQGSASSSATDPDAGAVTSSSNPIPAVEGFAVRAPQDGAALDAGPFEISGQATPGETVEVYEGTTLLDKVTADAGSGAWRVAVTPGGPGDRVYRLRSSGQNLRLGVSLRPAGLAAGALIPCPCNLRVATIPGEAVVTVFKGGTELSRQKGPRTLFERLEAGDYTYNVYQRGFRSFDGRFSLPRNRSLSVYLNKSR